MNINQLNYLAQGEKKKLKKVLAQEEVIRLAESFPPDGLSSEQERILARLFKYFTSETKEVSEAIWLGFARSTDPNRKALHYVIVKGKVACGVDGSILHTASTDLPDGAYLPHGSTLTPVETDLVLPDPRVLLPDANTILTPVKVLRVDEAVENRKKIARVHLQPAGVLRFTYDKWCNAHAAGDEFEYYIKEGTFGRGYHTLYAVNRANGHRVMMTSLRDL